MKKIIIVIISVFIILVMAGGAYVWYATQQPLYEPGMVRAEENLRAPLKPPKQPENAKAWQVEADILLSHFDVGQGRKQIPGKLHHVCRFHLF